MILAAVVLAFIVWLMVNGTLAKYLSYATIPGAKGGGGVFMGGGASAGF